MQKAHNSDAPVDKKEHIYLKGAYKQEGNQPFTQIDSDRTRGNSFKLKGETLRCQGKIFYWEDDEV